MDDEGCAALRAKSSMAAVHASRSHVSSAHRCPDGHARAGTVCLPTKGDDLDTNVYRCYLRCRHQVCASGGADCGAAERLELERRCEEFGGAPGCANFAAMDCAAIAEAKRRDGLPSAKRRDGLPSASGGAGGDGGGVDATATAAVGGGDLPTMVMALAHLKTRALEPLVAGARAAVQGGPAAAPPPVDDGDDVAARLYEIGAASQAAQDLFFPVGGDAADALVSEGTVLTSIHDACCQPTSAVEQLGLARLSETAVLGEVDKLEVLLARFAASADYDAARTCPGGEPMDKRCV